MNNKTELPKRKHPRLDYYDYSSAGAYFVTICTQNRQRIFSRIVKRGFAPVATIEFEQTSFGKIAEKQLFLLESRYPYLTIDHAIIMPDHIHAIMILNSNATEAGLRPSITDIICAYKSLTAKACKKNGFNGKLFQTSFHEHIIRDQEEYKKIMKYMYENPMHRYYDQ